jgi:hypothetical protein
MAEAAAIPLIHPDLASLVALASIGGLASREKKQGCASALYC